MTVIRDIAFHLDIKQALRYQGIQANPRPEILALTQELLSIAGTLLEPAVTYNHYKISEFSHDEVLLSGSQALKGPFLPSALKGASELVIAVCTIGPKLEETATRFISRNDHLSGVLLDGIGSANVDATLHEFCKIITEEVKSKDFQISSPLSPGMTGFPISEQSRLLELASASDIGVSLTPSGAMVPKKSVSAVIGLGPKIPEWAQAEPCAFCNLKKTCRYKKYAQTKTRS